MGLVFALIGNQNAGKTTLFNQLTGSNQHAGNFPGVTVEKKTGVVRSGSNMTVVDLPGIYSLSPYSSEEIVTRDFLINEKPDAIINIVDATNIERNLYLTLQLIELQMPMVVALNMMDEVRASGNSIDVLKMQKELGIPVIPISASRNEGVADLVEAMRKTAELQIHPAKLDFCSGKLHTAIHAASHVIEQRALACGIPIRFAATKLIEGDDLMKKALNLTDNESDILTHLTQGLEKDLHTDREAALADMRYAYIEKICASCVIKRGETREQLRSVQIDTLLTNKYLALPIFFVIMGLVFYLTFGAFGSFFGNLFSAGIDFVIAAADGWLSSLGASPALHSLIIDGMFAGIGSVLGFLPLIVVLFFFLSLLEDSGYMARVAFIMDKLLRKIGLSGRSFVPMLIGFGCSVPAIMATRTLSSERDRKMTIMLTPFMSCSAKLPIYALFTAAFFQKYQALVMIFLYVLGIIVGILTGLLFKNTIYKGEPIPFVMELPAYRMPSAKSVLMHMWEKARDFLVRAFTIIFVAAVVVWFLQSFDLRLNMTENGADSILAKIGGLAAPFFVPLGFGDWRVSTALLTGLSAKEVVVSTLSVLTGASGAALSSALGAIFTPLTALSFLTFTLLYTPCFAAVAAIRRELGSTKGTIFVIFYQIAAAWICSFIVYRLGILLGF